MYRSTKNDGVARFELTICLSDLFKKRGELAPSLPAALRSRCLTQNEKQRNGGKQAIKAMAWAMSIR